MKQMKIKRVLSLALVLCLGLSMLPMPVNAADLPFTDVPESQWYYNDVKTAYENGLVDGTSPTTFSPNDNLLYSQAIKLAACMHEKYTTGSVTLGNGVPTWYQSYVDYAKENNIISKDFAWNTAATRAGYMEIFVNALPEEALASINSVPDGSIPDVSMTHPNAADIYKLYRAGILQGVDAAFNCNPGANIRRSEVAAVLTRMMDSTARIKFSIGSGPQTPDITVLSSPTVNLKAAEDGTFRISASVSDGGTLS